MSELLSIIIPAYNEEKTIHFILDKVIAVKLKGGLEKEIILVNDCSSDNTRAVIKDYIDNHPETSFNFIEHKVNKGKGAA